MSQAVDDREKSRIALVVGLDLCDVSEHLLVTARDLVRSVDEHPDRDRRRIHGGSSAIARGEAQMRHGA